MKPIKKEKLKESTNPSDLDQILQLGNALIYSVSLANILQTLSARPKTWSLLKEIHLA